MREKIKQIMATVFMADKNAISDDIRQGDFEKWDSLMHLNLIVALEKHFNVTFEPHDIMNMTDLELIIRHVEQKLNK